MPSDIRNGYSYSLDFFTNQHRFVLRHAFSPTAAAPMLASWFLQSLPFHLVLPTTVYLAVTIAVVPCHGFMEDLVTTVIAEVLLGYPFAANIL